jgi:hypothetical protein
MDWKQRSQAMRYSPAPRRFTMRPFPANAANASVALNGFREHVTVWEPL